MSMQSEPILYDKAVIDVGSNSVRLVIFRTNATFFQPIFNEKVTASLGRGVQQSGVLNPKGAALAKTAIVRFMRIIQARNISQVYAVATAAVRDAKDGAAFLQEIKEKTGLVVQNLSGAEEARLSALGVIAGEPNANGLIADLGGSSLELVSIEKGSPCAGITRKLGPLAMGDLERTSGDTTIAIIDQALAGIKPISSNTETKTLYVVGGAWRSLALVHMELRGYPLHVLHNYRIGAKEAKRLCKLVMKQSPSSLAKIRGVSERRAVNLPYAALLLKRLLRQSKASEIVVSSFGLREGLLYDDLSAEEAARHPILTSVEALAHQNWSSPDFGKAVQSWLAPVFTHLTAPFGAQRTKMLQIAICQLADIGARMHPDHRAEIAFDLVLYAPFAGLSHAERACLALAVFHRCAGPATPPRVTLLMRLLDDDMREWAVAIGLGLRCAAAVSGRTQSLLKHTCLSISGGVLMLDAHDEQSALLTSTPTKRLRHLADAMDLRAKWIE